MADGFGYLPHGEASQWSSCAVEPSPCMREKSEGQMQFTGKVPSPRQLQPHQRILLRGPIAGLQHRHRPLTAIVQIYCSPMHLASHSSFFDHSCPRLSTNYAGVFLKLSYPRCPFSVARDISLVVAKVCARAHLIRGIYLF
jgi:hypothetical protein